jgi:NAD(P)-dependent dehydrogenase (short-subunit alcohol dehydrogenase family)
VEPLLDDPLRPDFLDVVETTLIEPLDGPTGYVLAKRGVMRACGHAPVPGSTADIADLVGFLCSERSFITGWDIRIDGGLIGNGRRLGSVG